MDGEAYLQVAPNPSKPFIVKAGTISTQVLGTSFNIRAYGEDVSIEVVVLEGKVKVSESADRSQQSAQAVELKANERAVFYKKEASLVQDNFDASGYNAWKGGQIKLVFDRIPLQDVIHSIERYYSVTIACDKTLADCPVHANLMNETARNAVELVALSMGARVVSHGKDLMMLGGVCH